MNFSFPPLPRRLRSRSASGVTISSPALVTSLSSSVGGSSPVGTSTLSVPRRSTTSSGTARSSESGTTSVTDLPLSVEARVNSASADFVSTWNLGLVLTSRVLVLLGLRVAVEVQIGHDVPLGVAGGEGSAEAEDLTGEHPPDETNGVTTLVVGGDGHIDVLGWGVGVAEGDDGDVDVRSLLDGLGVGAWVGDDDQAGLLEGTGDVVGEVTGGETTGDWGGTGVGGELEDGTLSVRAGGDDGDVGGVVDGGDDTGSEDNLLPEKEVWLVLRFVVVKL